MKDGPVSKRSVLSAYFALVVMPLSVSTAIAQPALETEEQKTSYMLGMEVGQSLKRTGVQLDMDAFSSAVSAVLNGEDLLLSNEEAAELQSSLMSKLRAQAQEQASAAGNENLAVGDAYRARNKDNDGVSVTDSGLQYEVLEEGSGAKPGPSDRVTVHYRGTLIDGTEFDSSYSRGQPATFGLDGVIPGWTEGLQLMAVGSKYRFVIPPQLAYGERGAGGAIGPNSTLVFEVELMAIE